MSHPATRLADSTWVVGYRANSPPGPRGVLRGSSPPQRCLCGALGAEHDRVLEVQGKRRANLSQRGQLAAPAPAIATSLATYVYGPGTPKRRLLAATACIGLVAWHVGPARADFGDPESATAEEFGLDAGLEPGDVLARNAIFSHQNLPFSFFHSDGAGTASIVSQCSTSLPSATRNRS